MQLPVHHIDLNQPAPYDYKSRTFDLRAVGKHDGAYVVLSYDDCNGGARIVMSPEDARALALKALGAAMDAER
jgi:hypothetical protein